MNRRYVILGLSVVLALALAVPAMGGPSNPVADISATAKSIANKALKKAKNAQNTANTANSTANNALGDAKTALSEAKKGVTNAATAQTAASGAQTTANGAKAAADAAQATANEAKAAADAANANANTRIKSTRDVYGPATASNNTTAKTASANCAAGEETLGGGWSLGGTETNLISVTDSEELFYGGGWFIAAEAISGTPTWSLTAIAMCGAK
jgi:hypothetical protein